MLKFAVVLHILAVALQDHATSISTRRREERGSVTIENVLWAVAVIAFVGIVVAAIRAYVSREAGKIN